MEDTELGIITFFSDVHFLNVILAIDFTEFGIVIRVSAQHSPKAPASIVVIESGMVMFVSEVQAKKAPSPMDVTEFGMLMLVSAEQPLKASVPIFFTEEGSSNDTMLLSFTPVNTPLLSISSMLLSNISSSGLSFEYERPNVVSVKKAMRIIMEMAVFCFSIIFSCYCVI